MIKSLLFSIGAMMIISTVNGTKKPEEIKLISPKMEGGKPLMQCLKERKSTRAFSPKQIPEQELSNLLWAAFGINRPEEKKRTAPSAMNRQEIDLYVMRQDGIYLYNAEKNILLPINYGDHRNLAGRQEFAQTAPITIFLVSDLEKMKGDRKMQEMFSGINAGYISQNIYLYCASTGLGTVARGSFDSKALLGALKLKPGQEIILAQSLGYPVEEKK
jgi:SagB-type dehydrogenase family enzyme